ncbi:MULTISPECIES: TetR/AcrR family transcriptional regulator [Kitasatospora]|uniref:Helix-turn-helix domain containing protein n=1 Tax=Kitasatospora cathayae TaxID=3004092 RepID=A0ABY7QDG2_9ACTN|nr:TetR/AcrR family transcriptional regulator [Kitasatospora sp. HUAS 3-15]WBP90279.1 helix-turn-helix domain containing protein [Kitasatospora sp. HUAS 3-15]
MTSQESAPPMRADARRNRARVLEAAQAAFATDGLLVPLDEIARRAGVGAGTVYRHFPTKEALFDAVILNRMEGLVRQARELAGAGRDDEALFEFITHVARESAAKKDLIDALAGAGIDVSANLAGINRDLRSAIEELLARGQRAGAVRSDVGIDALMALLRGIVLAGDRERDDKPLMERVLSVLCDGLRATAAR